MESSNKIIPAILSGVLVGFSMGAGWILAKRLLDRPKKSESVPVGTNNIAQDKTSSFTGGLYLNKNFMDKADVRNQDDNWDWPSAQNFDWKTGSF